MLASSLPSKVFASHRHHHLRRSPMTTTTMRTPLLALMLLLLAVAATAPRLASAVCVPKKPEAATAGYGVKAPTDASVPPHKKVKKEHKKGAENPQDEPEPAMASMTDGTPYPEQAPGSKPKKASTMSSGDSYALESPGAAQASPDAKPSYPAAAQDSPDAKPSYPAAQDSPDAKPSYPAAQDSPDAKPSYAAAQDSPDAKPSYPAAQDSPDAKPSYGAESSPDAEPGSPEGGKKKPKVSVQSIQDLLKKPVMHVLSPVIKSFCAKTDYKDVCEQSVAGLPEAPPANLDGVGVLKLLMEAVRSKAVEAMNAATDRMNAAGPDTVHKRIYDDCIRDYHNMRSDMEEVTADLNTHKDIATVRTALDNLATEVTSCDEGFEDRDGGGSGMGDYDQLLTKLTSNLLAVAAAIDEEGGSGDSGYP
ncbi:hypothetical protein ACP70R_007745 [Stipagrostis hirtigluma subsp. patula]